MAMGYTSQTSVFYLIQEAKDIHKALNQASGIEYWHDEVGQLECCHVQVPSNSLEIIRGLHQRTDTLLSKADEAGLINKHLLESTQGWVGSIRSIHFEEVAKFSSLSGNTWSNIVIDGSVGAQVTNFQKHFQDAANHVRKAGVRCLKGDEKPQIYGQTEWRPAKLERLPRAGFEGLHSFLTENEGAPFPRGMR